MRFKNSFCISPIVVTIVGILAVQPYVLAQSTIDRTSQPQSVVQTRSSQGGRIQSHLRGAGLDKTALVTIPEALVTPVIDGVFDPGEWSDALLFTPGTVVSPSSVWMKNDACYLYIAAQITGLTYFGNGNMVNIWFDVNANGAWDGINDGNLGIPAPGEGYPRDVAAWGYDGWGGAWSVGPYGYIPYHRPWSTIAMVVPETQIFVRQVNNYVSRTSYIEARIDYINSPVKLQGGVPFNMRMNTYAGYFTLVPYDGVEQIQGQWPTVNGWYWDVYPTECTDVAITSVAPPLDDLDVFDVRINENPVFGSKAYVTGSSLDLEIDYQVNPPPQTINYRVRFYGPYPSTALFTTISGSVAATSPAGTLTITVPLNIPIGFYLIEAEADDPWVCGIRKELETASILILGPGQIPCSVWPGDVNIDGIVNYGDKQGLWNYIHDANLNMSWLQGYYRLPPGYPEPLCEIEYVAQAALPWNTPEGCHMDTDGNGVVNSFDYVAVKVNWFRMHDPNGAKSGGRLDPASFSIGNNYPNPFNPATRLDFSLPERSTVSLIVTDMLGHTVATLTNGTIAEGSHTATFDASRLPSGQYIATIHVTGQESGSTFTKSVKMTLTK